jgi:hypothetical protein
MKNLRPIITRRLWQGAFGFLFVSWIGMATFAVGYEAGLRNHFGSDVVDLFEAPVAISPHTMLKEILPTGIPQVYGAELDISYDDVNPNDPRLANMTIETLSELDRTLTLEGSDMDRYVDMLHDQHNGMSCEFCCGARSIIFKNGEPACGCEHSYAMRGLAKYLILEHGSYLSDDDILTEIGKWKVLFFPGIHAEKAVVMKESGMVLNYINLTSNIYRGLEEGASSGGMIGNC